MGSKVSRACEVSLGRDWIRFHNQSLFSGEHDLPRRMLLKLFSLEEVVSVQLEPARATVMIRYDVAPERRQAFLHHCCDAMEGRIQALDSGRLPHWPRDRSVTWYRHGHTLSSWRVLKAMPGKLEIQYRALDNVAGRSDSVAKGMKQLPGVSTVSLSASSGKLLLGYDPQRLSEQQLLRAADDLVWNADVVALPPVKVEPVKFATVNTSLGLAAAGELVLPLATPLSAGIMLVTNVGTMRDAVRDIGKGKLTTPAWMMALLACSIVSGQVLAFALTDWSWRYWERRTRRELEKHQQRVVNESVVMPAAIEYVSAEGVEMHTPVEAIRSGEKLRMGSGQYVPFDVEIVSGALLVDEQAMTGEPHPVRKNPGDRVYAASRVLFGQADVSVTASHENSRAMAVVEDLNKGALLTVDAPEVKAAGQHLSDRSVPPTLAAAAVGLAMGNLFIVGAILHQDWFSAGHLAAPLATLQNSGTLMRQGLLLRDPGALYRLKQSRFLVIKDHPSLRLASWHLDALDHGSMNHDDFLRMVAGAGLYLGDARTDALLAACASQQLAVRQPVVLSLEEGALSVDFEHKVVKLTNLQAAVGELPSIRISVDGVDLGQVNFAQDGRPRAAEAIQKVRDLGVQVFLVSDRSEEETQALSQRLGADLCSGDMNDEQIARFIEGLAKRDLYPAYATADILNGEAAESAHVTLAIGFENDRAAGRLADIVLLGHRLDSLATLFTLSQSQDARLRKIMRSGLIPNLLCVVGGFAGVLNGITSGILGNLGVMGVQRQLARDMDASLTRQQRRLLR